MNSQTGILVVAIGCVLACPRLIFAQANDFLITMQQVSANQSVRVLSGQTSHEGRFVHADSDGMFLRKRSSFERIALKEIDSVLIKRAMTKPWVIKMALAGGVTGAILGAFAHSDTDGVNAAEGLAAGAGLGGLAGVGAGALIGAVIGKSVGRWTRLYPKPY